MAEWGGALESRPFLVRRRWGHHTIPGSTRVVAVRQARPIGSKPRKGIGIQLCQAKNLHSTATSKNKRSSNQNCRGFSKMGTTRQNHGSRRP